MFPHNMYYRIIYIQDSGVAFIVEEERKQLRGTLTVVSADNPAAQVVGGYKQLHSAVQKCCDCLAIDNMQRKIYIQLYDVLVELLFTNVIVQFVSEAFTPRDQTTHNYHVSLLNGRLHDHDRYATVYGSSGNLF